MQHSSGVSFIGPGVTPSPYCSLGSVHPGMSVVAPHLQHSSGALSCGLAITPHCPLGSIPLGLLVVASHTQHSSGALPNGSAVNVCSLELPPVKLMVHMEHRSCCWIK